MGRAKRSGGLNPSASRVGGPPGPALCIASKGCPLALPSRRISLGKKPEIWSDGYPERRGHFDSCGQLIACTCEGHEGVQLQTVEDVAVSRGRVITTSYVFISDEGPAASVVAQSPPSPAAAPATPAAAPAGAGAAAAGAAAAGAAAGVKKRPRGSKARELWLALSQMEGSSGYLSAPSVTLGGRGSIDLRRLTAVPMLAKDRGPLSFPRTLKEEVLLAITEGATHDLLKPAKIERKDHHIRGLPSLRKKERADVVGCIWTGPRLGKDEVIVAGAYLGEVRYDVAQANAMEQNRSSSSSSISISSSSSGAALEYKNHSVAHRTPESSTTNVSSSKPSTNRILKSSSSSSSSSSSLETDIYLSPLKSMSMDYGMSCGWDSASKGFVQLKAQKRIVFHPLARAKKDKARQGNNGNEKETPRIIPSDELGLQSDGSVVLPGHDWMCIDAEHYFNITSLVNDSRSILDAKRLKDTFIFHEVHYEGFPYLVLFKRQGRELLHMEECLVNCGPLFRLGHLQPLCEAALYDEADAKPSPGTREYEEMPLLKLCAMDWEDRYDLMDSFYRTKRAKEAQRDQVVWESDNEVELSK